MHPPNSSYSTVSTVRLITHASSIFSAPDVCTIKNVPLAINTLSRLHLRNHHAAELLRTDKLSELAILTLFLMYEKKLKEDSFWQPYIKELDRQRARGTQAVESPLLWDTAELEELLQGTS